MRICEGVPGLIAMKALQATWRFVSNAWLAAGPVILLFAFVIGVPAFFAVVHAIARIIAPEAADDLFMDVIIWTAIGLLVLTPIGLTIYAVVRLARWLVGGEQR